MEPAELAGIVKKSGEVCCDDTVSKPATKFMPPGPDLTQVSVAVVLSAKHHRGSNRLSLSLTLTLTLI